MNRLAGRIAGLIRAAGPISVADYMATCLFDPDLGYYTTQEPFGVEGDFITAPEVSQMFGELVGAWLVQAWQAIGKPSPVSIVEIGPGRGTLMKDMVRTVGKIAPDLAPAIEFVLVETSSRLIEVQAETLRDSGPTFVWLNALAALPEKPALFVGNEIFDALPFRQFIRQGDQWRERVVAIDAEDHFRLAVGTASLAPNTLPAELRDAPDGSIFEIAPVREALMADIAARIARNGGVGIFFDYGHFKPGLGDTFQALRNHRSESVFDNPGEADLTSHVDFSALANVARAHGLETHTSTQGEFLLGLGLLERAGRLGQHAGEDERQQISAAVERLAGPDQMGNLFKVLSIQPAGVALPPFPNAS